MDAVNEVNSSAEKPKKKNLAKFLRTGILIILIIGTTILGIRWWIQLSTTVSTDNAKVSADLVGISAEVSGKLTDVRVQEGDTIKAGQLLAKVEDSQYLINTSQAEATWKISQIAITKLPNDIKAAQMAVSKAENALFAANSQAAISKLAMEDSHRILDKNTTLYQQGAVSKEIIDSYTTKYETAAKAFEAANADVNSAMDSVSTAQAQLDTLNKTGSATYAAQEKQARATYDNAQLALARTSIKSPISGNIVKVTALQGQNVSSGTILFTIVNPERIWVIANIEEKKVARIRPGQNVIIDVDAYPNTVFKGRVEEISGAAQSSFSILPTDNASGNYTKVAQRLPVKISVAQQDNMLRPGMSVKVTIKTR